MADAASMAAGVPRKIKPIFRRAMTIIALTGVPCVFILPKKLGRFPSSAIEYIALEAPRKAVWIMRIIAAISIRIARAPPMGPRVIRAKGSMGENGSAMIPSIRVPVQAA